MRAISSCTVLAGTLGCTLMTLGVTPTLLMGAKALTGSVATLGFMLGLTTRLVLTRSSV